MKTVTTLADLVRTPDELTVLPEDEIAAYMLSYIHSQYERGYFHPQNCVGLNSFLPESTRTQNYPSSEVELKLSEGLSFLIAKRFIVPTKPAVNHFSISSIGHTAVESREGFSELVRIDSLPLSYFHPKIQANAYPMLRRQLYDAALFQAFKEVEIAVNAKMPDAKKHLYGDPLMRAAFDSQKGPLSDMADKESERKAVADLFSGAIGHFRNRFGHKHVGVATITEAVEGVMFASCLLRILDTRK